MRMDRLKVNFVFFFCGYQYQYHWININIINRIIGPKRLFLWRCRNRFRFEANSDFGANPDAGSDFDSEANSRTDSETDSKAVSGTISGN